MPASQARRKTAEKGIDDLCANLFTRLKFAVIMTAEDIATQGMKNAPILEGHLRRSIQREADFKIAQVKGKLQMNVIAPMPYAADQHENTAYRHPRGGRSHYLSGPAEERKDKYAAFVAEQMTRALEDSEA